ncbi:MAG: TatD family hydrolase [Microthrixaceae bacterium]
MADRPEDAAADVGPWVDNHCHLGLDGRDGEPTDVTTDVTTVLESARGRGVVAMITVGTDAASSSACLELARRHESVWATAGLHPHDAVQGTDELRDVLAAAAGSPELVAVGECGLDYHYDHSPRARQREVFAEQVALAHEMDLPLVIHTRAAWDDTFDVLDDVSVPRRTVFHCFTGGPGEAERCLERGALLSISGIVTFPSAQDVRDAVRTTPLSSLMVETDAPFLTPVPHRGRPNEPAHVGLVGSAVARELGVDVADVAAATTATATEFYGIGSPER